MTEIEAGTGFDYDQEANDEDEEHNNDNKKIYAVCGTIFMGIVVYRIAQ